MSSVSSLHPASVDIYGSDFYSGQVGGALASARIVLRRLFEFHRPHSILDVGCGQGAWLAAAGELGCERLVGVDGPWVDSAALLGRNISFSTVDLEKPLAHAGRYDLCISVEVAEHLSPPRAGDFVGSLCAASDVVLFSAAIRLQGGTFHRNEQPQSFWAARFHDAGYDCHDVIRPALWTNPNVESWYRQNMLLYVQRSHPLNERLQSRQPCSLPLDVVHPAIYEGNLENYKRAVESPTLRFCCTLLQRWSSRQWSKFSGQTRSR